MLSVCQVALKLALWPPASAPRADVKLRLTWRVARGKSSNGHDDEVAHHPFVLVVQDVAVEHIRRVMVGVVAKLHE